MRGIVLILLAAPMLSIAQQREAPGQPVPLSLSRAIDIATAPDGAARLQLATELIKQAEAQKALARGALLPNLDGSWTYRSFTQNLEAFGLQIRAPGIPFQIPPFVGPISTYDTRATATQSILDLGSIRRYQAAGARAGAVTEEQRAAREQVSGQVAKAYANAARAQQTLKTAEANVALAERMLRLARSQKEAGTGTGMEITRAEAQLAGERQRWVTAQEEVVSSRLQLKRAMNLTLDAEIELTDALSYKPVELPDAKRSTETARGQRYEIRAQSLRELSAKRNADAAWSDRLPSLAAFGDYGVIGTSFATGLPTRSVGVKLNIPIYDGGRRDARRAEANSLLRQERIRSADTARQVELEVRTSIEALRAADELVKAASETLRLSEKELEQAQRRFEAGVASGLEITDAQTRLARARESNVLALFRHMSARIDYGLATGALDSVLTQ